MGVTERRKVSDFHKFYISFSPRTGMQLMQLRSATFAAIILPLRVTRMATPSSALHGHRHAKKCAHVSNGTVQLLEGHVQRLALGTARLLVQPDALHIKTFENRLIQKLLRILCVLNPYVELDPPDEVRNKPVQPHQVFIRQKAFNPCRLQTALRQ